MASLVTTIRETLRYKGAIGQWSWVLHRLTGLGVVLFLFLHVIDTSWAVFAPGSYELAIKAYQSPLFTLGEFGLVAAVVYHALNGLRIVIFDYKPEWWEHQQRAAWYVLGGTAIILVPVFIGMFGHVIEHYSHDPYIMPLAEVIWEQRIFAGLFIAGAVAAFGASFIAGQLGIGEDAGGPKVSAKHSGSAVEKFWWSFMRISGVLIIPLVFGHLAGMHILQGVFDLTLAGSNIAGVAVHNQAVDSLAEAEEAGILFATVEVPNDERTGTIERNAIIPNGINDSGLATEFVNERWGYLVGGVAVWRIYDALLLILVVMHGFNGLRYVLTDYTMGNPLLRRSMTYITILGGIGLLVVGVGALLGSVDQTSLDMAAEALRHLQLEG